MIARIMVASVLASLVMAPQVSQAGFVFGTSNIPSSDNVNFGTNTNVTSFTGVTSKSVVTLLFNNPDPGTTLDTNNGQSVSIDPSSPLVWTTLTATVQSPHIGLTGVDLKLQPHNAVTTDGSADWVTLQVFGGGESATSGHLDFQTSSGQSDFNVTTTGNSFIIEVIWTVHYGSTNNTDSQKQFSVLGTTTSVPEPSSSLLTCLGGGVLGLASVTARFRRRKAG
jgi:hypothetical protein